MRGAIFGDVSQALTLSFTMQTHPAIDAGATRRALVTMATMNHASSRMQRDYVRRLIGQPSRTVDFSGLSKLEVRAQCALVRKHAAEWLDAPHASAVLARFASTHSEREAGINGLAKHLCSRASPLGDVPCAEAVCMLTVRRYRPHAYRNGFSFRDIAKKTAVPKSTLARLANRIECEADHLEAEALTELERFFVPRGICNLTQSQSSSSSFVLRLSDAT
jgi:hypothetical protein